MPNSRQYPSKIPSSTTSPDYVPQKVPTWHVFTSGVGFGPIPLSWLTTTLALVWEQRKRIMELRPSASLSNREAFETSRAIGAALRIRDAGAAKLARIVDQFDAAQADIAAVIASLPLLDEQPVIGVRGELLTVRQAEDRLGTIAGEVTAEADAGSLKHRRTGSRLRRLAPWATGLDFIVLCYFLAQVFNVDLAGVFAGDGASLGQSIIPLLTTITFALLGTVVVAVGLHFFAHDLRGYKDEHGHPSLPSGDATFIPSLYLAVSALVAIGAGIVMAYRIVTDSLAAGNGGLGGVILGLFFAVVVVILNVVVFSAHYRDGSTKTEELDQLAAQVNPVRNQRIALNKKLIELDADCDRLVQAGERIDQLTRTKMSRPLAGADQLRLLARSYHQGCGWEATFVVPDGNPPQGLLLPRITVDTTVLDQLIDRLRSSDTGTADQTPEIASSGHPSKNGVRV